MTVYLVSDCMPNSFVELDRQRMQPHSNGNGSAPVFDNLKRLRHPYPLPRLQKLVLGSATLHRERLPAIRCWLQRRLESKAH